MLGLWEFHEFVAKMVSSTRAVTVDGGDGSFALANDLLRAFR